MTNNKIIVGVLIGNICSSYADDLLNGLVHRAADADCDVQTLYFMGAHANCFDELYYYEGANKEQKYLFQYNTVFDYAKLGKLDVLIVVFSSFYLYMGETKEQFFERFKDMTIPIIIVGDEYGDYISVNSDNGDGIRKCIEHLIEKHGCEKIAYLGGPKENNRDAKERLEAYYQVMEENGFEIQAGMIEYGDYSANSASLFGKILDNNPDIDAVVCANDTMALSGYEECKKRGLIPGKDIAITGFDDIPEAKSSIPALTTVEQNSYDLGYMAMKKAEELCQQGNTESVKVPVYFKHRESCGREKTSFEEVTPEISKLNSCEEIARRCSKEILQNVSLYKISIVEDENVRELLYRVFYHILQVYMGEQEAEYDVEFIDVSMHTLINSQKFAMDGFVTEFCRQMTTVIFWGKDRNKKRRLSRLLIHILDYIQNITLIEKNNKINALQRNIWTTPFITRDMIANIDDDLQLYEALMERFRFMQVNNAYLFLLQEPRINCSIGDWNCPDELMLVAKIENGVISKVEETEKLNRENGFRDIILWESCKNMAVYALFAGKRMYGVMTCEMTEDNITSMYSASLHIGSAFQFIELTKNQRKIQAELEQAMTEIKNKNDILNMLSEKDELTKLYNRRGFLENAMTLISGAKNNFLLCIYADLDHLKQINDQFGHQEGDFAIKQAAKYMQDSLKSSDVIGRIGGDEFAALAIIKNENMAVEIRDKIILNSKLFNQSSDKPYYVDLSIGYAVYKWSEGLELNQMLSTADLMLYESKKKKRKDARK